MKVFALPWLERYKKIFKRVAQKYLEHLNHRSLMAGKLSDILVYIARSEDGVKSNGRVELDYINERVVHRMFLFINVNDSDKQIASIMAHELAHTLFASTNDYYFSGSASKSGCEPFGSSFRRIDQTIDLNYGIGLEEGAAEVLARYIISHCRFSDAEGTYAKEKSPETYYSMLSSLTELLANCFGEPLFGTRYIDGISVEKYIVEKGHPLYEEMNDTYDEELWEKNRHFYRKSVENPFWYHAITNTFHRIINEYDECMGVGAFSELCKHLDGLYNQYYEYPEDTEAYEIAFENKKKAEEMIREFDEKYKTRHCKQLLGIAAKYDQYVQEQKANKKSIS